MLFEYSYVTKEGQEEKGKIEASSRDMAIRALQNRGIVLTSIKDESNKSVWEMDLKFLEHVKQKDIVILSRQIATLFEAKVAALRVFRLLSEEVTNKLLKEALIKVADDLQGGSTISGSLAKHPKIFSDFYVNMVAAGEESGKLDDTFNYLADYLDRTYELNSKAKGAMVYPAFVIITFFAVMTLMLAVVIPRITKILTDSGQPIPFYTKITIALSDIVVNFGPLVLVVGVVAGFFFTRWVRTEKGAYDFNKFLLKVPAFGSLFQKLYLSRIADNMNTMLMSGISMIRSMETTARVVGSPVYEEVLEKAIADVRAGKTVADAMTTDDKAIPGIMLQMIRIGEETGELGNILKTLSGFYQREVNQAVDTLVSLIEPAMIILLGVGVGFLLTSVLMPIYNISAGIN